MVIGTTLLCSHPSFKPKQKVTEKIVCYPSPRPSREVEVEVEDELDSGSDDDNADEASDSFVTDEVSSDENIHLGENRVAGDVSQSSGDVSSSTHGSSPSDLEISSSEDASEETHSEASDSSPPKEEL